MDRGVAGWVVGVKESHGNIHTLFDRVLFCPSSASNRLSLTSTFSCELQKMEVSIPNIDERFAVDGNAVRTELENAFGRTLEGVVNNPQSSQSLAKRKLTTRRDTPSGCWMPSVLSFKRGKK